MKCHGEFPNVNYVDHIGGEGRTKSDFVANAVHYSKESARMRTGLTTACTDADYLINMALLKGHVGQGVTLCGKNWYGVVDIEAAMADYAPSQTQYDPEGDGSTLKSLGVAEHWNNAVEKKYTKIELVYKKK